MKIIIPIVVFVFVFFAFIAIAQWLWSIFCPVFGLQEMTFWQMTAFLVFVSAFLAPCWVKR